MIIRFKDAAKLLGLSIIACCAVLVCNLFLNFNLDLGSIETQITDELTKTFYRAMISTGKVISAVSGGCLLLTSVVVLCFYIGHYIETHRRELGVLKALGYSNLKIASYFGIFGIGIFIGAAFGFVASYMLMPAFYKVQTKEGILPAFSVRFHPFLALCFLLLPTLFFSLLAIIYSYRKLKKPALQLLHEAPVESFRNRKTHKGDLRLKSFMQEIKKVTLQSRKSLAFFVFFAAFCFSSMLQMSFSMDELADVLFSIMLFTIGAILACTTLFLAITAVVNSNAQTISMMRIMGYSQQECCSTILGGYRLFAYIGFAVGTVYQYALLKGMIVWVFSDIEGIPKFHFDIQALVITLISFLILYELVMICCAVHIRKISFKAIMLK